MDTASARIVTDLAALERLKARARSDQAGAAKEVARQFEALLMQTLLKDMRHTGLGPSLLDNPQGRLYRDLYDQQLASQLAGHGLGLERFIAAHLPGAPKVDAGPGRGLNDYRAHPTRTPVPRAHPAAGAASAPPVDEPPFAGPEDFVRRLAPHAEAAARELGIPGQALLAQAALETGWGAHQPEVGGRPSHNLFGIKAGPGWQGARVRRETLEYEDGVAVRRSEPFRAYASYAESFSDYVAFLKANPRYREALQQKEPRAWFEALQRAGYATDPAYADKVMDVYRRLPPPTRVAEAAPAKAA